MARQIDHLADVSQRAERPPRRDPLGNGGNGLPVFRVQALPDRRTVVVGLPSGARFLNDPDDVSQYVGLLGQLEQLAVFDDAARVVLGDAAAEYRRAPTVTL